MIGTWRLSHCNAVLVAAYLVPAWAVAAWRIAEAPIRGFYERANIAFALTVSDSLQLTALGMARMAWTLVVVRLTVAAFFVIFLVQIANPPRRQRGDGDEALAIGLTLGGLVSFAGMVLAAQAGEAMALRLHATESLLLVGAAILVLAEPLTEPLTAPPGRTAAGQEIPAVTP